MDYLGYGTTLGTWFLKGEKVLEVTATVDSSPGLEVDEHSVVVARYETGLSKFETRGAFTDPWSHQPQPKCGFVLVETEPTLFTQISRIGQQIVDSALQNAEQKRPVRIVD